MINFQTHQRHISFGKGVRVCARARSWGAHKAAAVRLFIKYLLELLKVMPPSGAMLSLLRHKFNFERAHARRASLLISKESAHSLSLAASAWNVRQKHKRMSGA
jgi:hypothetical protein